MSITDEIGRDNLVFGVFQNSLHGSAGSLLDLGANFFITRFLTQSVKEKNLVKYKSIPTRMHSNNHPFKKKMLVL